MIKLSKAVPEDVFALLKAIADLGECSLNQVRAYLKAQWPGVRSARTFAEEYGLIHIKEKKISLSSLGKRLLLYQGKKRVDFTLRHWRLQDQPPFRFLQDFLRDNEGEASVRDLVDAVRVKFAPRDKWSSDDRKGFGEALGSWMEHMGLATLKGNVITYTGGVVITPGVFSLLELEFLKERELRDWLLEEFESPRAILNEPRDVLSQVEKEENDKLRAKLFERFVAVSSRRLGFSYRTQKSGSRKDARIPFKDNLGGGDVVILYHHPLQSKTRAFEGGAIACEVKSTEGNVGSGAVGQARNLVTKVEGAFPEYHVVPVVISRSKIGYDPSGRDLAPPEVVHLTHRCLLSMLEFQRRRISAGGNLILPSHVFQLLDDLVKEEEIEPSVDEIQSRLRALVGSVGRAN